MCPITRTNNGGTGLLNGIYLNNDQICEAPPFAISKEKAQKLWQLSEEIVAENLRSV